MEGGLAAEARIEQGQHGVLAPLAVQVLSILPLTSAGIDELVEAKTAVNPLLLAGAASRCRWCGARARGGRCASCRGGPARTSDRARVESPFEGLRREARAQAPTRLASVVDAAVDSLDERGLLGTSMRDLSTLLRCSEQDVADAVAAIRAVGPPGVAAAGAVESLGLQAAWHVERGAPPALALIVPTYLEQVAAGDHGAIAGALGLAPDAVSEAVAFLQHRLRPYPVFEDAGPRASEAGPPDVIVRTSLRSPGALEVQVLDTAALGLRLDEEVLRAGADGDDQTRRWLAERRQEATSFLDLLDRRAATLRSVAQEVIVAQAGFVLQGLDHHLPLTRAEVAESLAVHPSTVTRAVQGKVVRLPDGRMVPLAAFFGKAVATKVALGELLRSRTRRTDAELAAELAAAGHRVARRTVAKYRHQLEESGAV